MPRKRFTIEQIINHLREAEVLLSQGQTVGEVCRRIGISEQSYPTIAETTDLQEILTKELHSSAVVGSQVFRLR